MSISTDLIELPFIDCYQEAAKRKVRSKTKGNEIHFEFRDGSTLIINYNGREATAEDGGYSVRRDY